MVNLTLVWTVGRQNNVLGVPEKSCPEQSESLRHWEHAIAQDLQHSEKFY